MNKEVKVGLFMTIALVLLYFGFNYLKGIDFLSSTNKYYAIYDNVDQLAVSNPVLVNGYAVGRVSYIRIVQEKENKVLVELDIDSDIILGDSATAILNSDFLGSKSILLNIGDKSKPHEPGDTILAEAARGIFDVFTETAEPVANNVQTTLRKLNTVLDNLAVNSARLDTLFMKLKYTPGLVNRALITTDEKMNELSSSFKQTSDNLSVTLRDLRPVISNFKTFSDSLKQIELNMTLAKAQETLGNLNSTLSKLSSGDNTVSKLMTDDSLYVNL
ncbi:MAG TPA: MlaD family protein, partial [Cyclobacteriaceae bacterium]|nr:MlaD family protein [Cyclobacteriaceae bacterium]